MKRSFCIVDVETVSFKPHRDNIWSVSGIKVVEGSIDSVFDSLVKPRDLNKAREFYTASGRGPDEFEKAAPIEIVMEKAFEFFKGLRIYAYNAPFDKRMLSAGYPPFKNLMYVDYLKILKQRKPNLESYKLGNVSEHFKLENRKKGYDSMKDCYVLLNLINRVGL